MKQIGKLMKIKIAAIAVVVVVAAAFVWWLNRETEVNVSGGGHMEDTPVEIEQIRSIGEWEFLSISDEEIADTIRHGFFGDDELSRIYYGTLRLGIDMSEASEDWITTDADTTVIKLPPVKLLDDNFIDEARTKSFIEDGKWTESDRAALTRKAVTLMRRRCLTRANYAKAESNAKKQVAEMIKGMGAKYVRVEFAGKR